MSVWEDKKVWQSRAGAIGRAGDCQGPGASSFEGGLQTQ